MNDSDWVVVSGFLDEDDFVKIRDWIFDKGYWCDRIDLLPRGRYSIF